MYYSIRHLLQCIMYRCGVQFSDVKSSHITLPVIAMFSYN